MLYEHVHTRRDRPPTVEGTRELLAYVSADCPHDPWVAIAMAIKSGLGEAGWPVFEEWSKTGSTYDPRTCRATWDSIKADGPVTYGTLVHHARAEGWQLPSKRNTRRTRPPGRALPHAREDVGRGPGPERSTEPPTTEVARAILAAVEPADFTLARVYLARRGTWPPITVGPDLPATVRWLEADKVKALPTWTRNGEEMRLVLPPDAAGVVVFEFARPGQPPDGVSLTAVGGIGKSTGNRVLFNNGKKALTLGWRSGRVFEARNVSGGSLWLVEGECDALALTLCGHGGLVRSVPTSGYQLSAMTDPERRNVVLVPDWDAKGTEAGVRLYRQALEANVTRRVCLWPSYEERLATVDGGDPADRLAEWSNERIGIRECDGKMHRVDAFVAGWNDVLSAVGRGHNLIPVPGEGT